MSDTPGDTQADDAYTNDSHANDAYTIGVILKGAREANGESIEDVARLLRINWRYLQALEEGEFGELPGTVYAIGFIRTYADHLGIDGAILVDQYKALGSVINPKSALDFPEPIPESGLPGGAIMFAGIVVAILAYGGWYLATEENSFLTRMVSPVPEHLAETTDQGISEEETVVQPVEQEVIEETAAQPVEQEIVEETAEQPEASVEVAEEVAPATEPIIEITTESTAEGTTDSLTEPITEAVDEAPTEAVATEAAPEVNTDEATTEPLAEALSEVENASEQVASDVQETVETVAEETVVEVSEAVSPEPVVESEPVGEPKPVAEVTEDTDAHALNEEQLQAVQETLSIGDTVTPSTAEAVEDVIQDVVEEVAETDAASDSGDTQIATAPTEEVTVTETVTGRVYGEQGAGRIIVRARINSWIQVRDDTSGELLLTRLLRAGDEYHVPDRDGLSLLTGNAGALEILVDGTTAPAIGATGDVRRDVALDADRLLSGDAAN